MQKYYQISLVVMTLLLGLQDGPAQAKYDYTWVFGSDASSLPGAEGSIIQFHDGGIDTFYQQLPVEIGTENISISTIDGDLIAYSNACDVYNSDFEVMENGEDINPGEVHEQQCGNGNYGGAQNSLMLPDPAGGGCIFIIRLLRYCLFRKWLSLDLKCYIVISIQKRTELRKKIYQYTKGDNILVVLQNPFNMPMELTGGF